MKNLFKNSFLLLAILIGSSAIAQDSMNKEMSKSKHKVIELTQTPGEFVQQELNLKAGETYVFQVTNKGVDHEVGFVVAPKGKPEQVNHIKNAYVKKMVKNGESQMSNEVVLEAGEYIFFCPMNPTPQYIITVE